MRQAFVHDAVVAMNPGGDVRAPGAAITVALCGHWEHKPPCPLASHRTDAQLLVGPDGVTTRWRLDGAQPGLLRDDETQHAEQLIQS